MRTPLFSIILILIFEIGFGQYKKKQEPLQEEVPTENDVLNKWTLEFGFGQSKGIRPFSENYYSSNNQSVFGTFQINHFELGARYMINSRFGIKGILGYDKMKPSKNSESLPFETNLYTFGIHGVVNISRLFNTQEYLGRFGILFHLGGQLSYRASVYDQTSTNGVKKGTGEFDGGIMFGLSPTYRISNKFSLFLEAGMVSSFRQQITWDGHYANTNQNSTGQYAYAQLGFTYSFGKKPIHGDWAVLPDKQAMMLEPLQDRIDELETMMNDSDKDGVPDYLDQEINSIPGIAVDTKGRMIDLNNNGVPDELERYIVSNNKVISDKVERVEKDIEMERRLINEGYISAYFDIGKTTPTNVSTEGIDFILTYLRSNPNSVIEIYGHADEDGVNAKNIKLAENRAKAVKEILTKAGIAPNRLVCISKGVDKSVDKNSTGAKKLVRRVTFKIK